MYTEIAISVPGCSRANLLPAFLGTEVSEALLFWPW